MGWRIRCLCLGLSLFGLSTNGQGLKDPLIIGHRGSCGRFPEHTLESYRHAILEGADFIECDVVMTMDGELVCRHEPNIIDTTDVEHYPEFADRRKTYIIDGVETDGFFTVDFTLAELKRVRAVQRLKFRDPSYDGMFEIPTLKEYLAVAKSSEWKRSIGIYPETKHPTWHASLGLKLEDTVLEHLEAAGFLKHGEPIFLQSFEPSSLQYLRNRTQAKLVQLLDEDWDKPDYIFPIIPDNTSHPVEELLQMIATWADAIGPSKGSIVPVDPETNKARPPTQLVELAHAQGLEVHPYTFRNEYLFLAFDYGQDPYKEYEQFFDELQVDGLFSDFPATAARYLRTRTCWRSDVQTLTGMAHDSGQIPPNRGLKLWEVIVGILLVAAISLASFCYPRYFKRDALPELKHEWQEMATVEQL